MRPGPLVAVARRFNVHRMAYGTEELRSSLPARRVEQGERELVRPSPRSSREQIVEICGAQAAERSKATEFSTIRSVCPGFVSFSHKGRGRRSSRICAGFAITFSTYKPDVAGSSPVPPTGEDAGFVRSRAERERRSIALTGRERVGDHAAGGVGRILVAAAEKAAGDPTVGSAVHADAGHVHGHVAFTGAETEEPA